MRLEYFAAAGQTLVPNVFIDKYMAEANGEFVKVYLCLLRMQSAAEISVESLAERLDLSERTVERALKYLEKCSLVKLFYDAEGHMNGIRMLPGTEFFDEAPQTAAPARSGSADAKKTPAEKTASAAAKTAANAKQPAAAPPAQTGPAAEKAPAVPQEKEAERRRYRPTEVSRLCEEDGEFNMLVTVVAPAYLNRTLQHNDLEIFAWLHHDLQLPVDVLEYCVEQCVERKKEDYSKKQFMRYIESVARSWHEEGVKTLEQARAAAARFDEKVAAAKENAKKDSAGTQAAGADQTPAPSSRRKKQTVSRSPKIQAAYGFSMERQNVDYNAIAWSRMWEEK